MTALLPTNADELAAIVCAAAAEGRRLEIRGGGSKAGIGIQHTEAQQVSMKAIEGIVDYDPAELTLTVRPGTALADVEALVAGQGQMLAFDPFDHGPIFGEAAGSATIGGIVAAGVTGSRRVSAGGARDHLLRVVAVSGRGETFVAGAKVVKNVTGYDLPKLLCGSWGRFAALTEVTLKVLPRPRASMTLVYRGLSDHDASRVMLTAMGSTASVSAAAHIPGLWNGQTVTGLRLEGIEPSIRARIDTLALRLHDHGAFELLDEAGADAFWSQLRFFAPLANGLPLWRVHLPARSWVGFVEAMRPFDGHYMVDWGGSLVWLESAAPAAALRQAAEVVGGHAMLVRRGPDSGATPVFHPQARAITELEQRLRRGFDPNGVFDSGRFGDSDAD
jgi:glycolate oxidase FAD binding subunit